LTFKFDPGIETALPINLERPTKIPFWATRHKDELSVHQNAGEPAEHNRVHLNRNSTAYRQDIELEGEMNGWNPSPILMISFIPQYVVSNPSTPSLQSFQTVFQVNPDTVDSEPNRAVVECLLSPEQTLSRSGTK
jgi:hypothetical protein